MKKNLIPTQVYFDAEKQELAFKIDNEVKYLKLNTYGMLNQ